LNLTIRFKLVPSVRIPGLALYALMAVARNSAQGWLTLELPRTRFVVVRREGRMISLQVIWLYMLLLRVVKSIQLSFIAGRRALPNRCTSIIKPILITRAALLYLNKPDNTPAKLHIFSQSIT
jgi:hypothetical protein